MISIAISTFESNGEGGKLIEYNLDKILLQIYKNFEVVISDHSRNNLILDVINKDKYKSMNIKYIKNDSKYGNSSFNTNNAINNCSGDLIKILFMDDYLYDENSLTTINNIFSLEENKNKMWLANSYLHTNNYTNFFRRQVPTFKNHTIELNKIGCPSGITLRKDVKDRFDINLKWFMDTEYYIRLLRKYGSPIFLDEILVINYLHNNQVSNTQINKDLIKFEKNYIINKYNR